MIEILIIAPARQDISGVWLQGKIEGMQTRHESPRHHGHSGSAHRRWRVVDLSYCATELRAIIGREGSPTGRANGFRKASRENQLFIVGLRSTNYVIRNNSLRGYSRFLTIIEWAPSSA